MTQVFISYSRRNAEFVVKLAADLKKYHIPVWLDQYDIKLGTRWDLAIDAALKACSHVLAVLSPMSVQSQNVLDEIHSALDEGKTIIPVEIETCEAPFRIRRLQKISFVTQSYEAAFQRVLGALMQSSLFGDLRYLPTRNGSGGKLLVVNKQTVYDAGKIQAGDANPTLVFQESTQLAHVPMMQITLVIGRGSECDIVVRNKSVSREHILITVDGGDYRIEDLGSTNGTLVNGTALDQPRVLLPGDRIDLAKAVSVDFHPELTETSLEAYHGALGGLPTPPFIPTLDGDDSYEPTDVHQTVYAHHAVEIDLRKRAVMVGGKPLDPPLTSAQYTFLQVLFEAKGAVCTRDQIARAVWPQTGVGRVSNEIIQTVATRINERLAELDPDWQYIIAEGNYSYRFCNHAILF